MKMRRQTANFHKLNKGATKSLIKKKAPITTLVHQNTFSGQFMGTVKLCIQPCLKVCPEFSGARSIASRSGDVSSKATKYLVDVFVRVPATQLA